MYIGKLVTIKEASKSKVQNKQTKVVLCPIGGKATKLPETYRGKYIFKSCVGKLNKNLEERFIESQRNHTRFRKSLELRTIRG